jgi:hypothetical protein
MTTTKVLLLLLFAGRCEISTGEERISNHGPGIEELLDVFDLKRLTAGWRRAVTAECGDDVTSFLAALGNGTLWANKSEYITASLQRSGQNVTLEIRLTYKGTHRIPEGSN